VILILTKYYHADSTKVLESSLWRRQELYKELGRTKHQQAARSKVEDRRVALRGQSRHLFGQIAYQHGTGHDGGHRQCQGKGSSLAGRASSI
ncbi:hypothetical protein FQN60_007013, partial [Etheostoma spectabile]